MSTGRSRSSGRPETTTGRPARTAGFLLWNAFGNSVILMPVVFGCLVSVITFFVVNWIDWARGVEPAPSAYLTAEEEAAVLAKEAQEM